MASNEKYMDVPPSSSFITANSPPCEGMILPHDGEPPSKTIVLHPSAERRCDQGPISESTKLINFSSLTGPTAS